MLAAVGGQVGSMAFDLHFFHPIFVAESCTKLGGGVATCGRGRRGLLSGFARPHDDTGAAK